MPDSLSSSNGPTNGNNIKKSFVICQICGSPTPVIDVKSKDELPPVKMPAGLQALTITSKLTGILLVLLGIILIVTGFLATVLDIGMKKLSLVIVGPLIAGYGVFHFIMGSKLGRGDSNSRLYHIGVCMLGFIAFPYGSILNAFFLYSLFSNKSKLWCDGTLRPKVKLEGETFAFLILIMGIYVTFICTFALQANSFYQKMYSTYIQKQCFNNISHIEIAIESLDKSSKPEDMLLDGIILEGDGTLGPVYQHIFPYLRKKIKPCRTRGTYFFDTFNKQAYCTEHGRPKMKHNCSKHD